MRHRTLISNSRAFTLVEVMVAIMILTVGLLGMLQVINLAIATNMQNDFRNQAVLIAEEQLAQKKSLPFSNITASTQKSLNVQAPLRNTSVNYSVTYRVDDVGNSKKIDIGVRWQFKNNTYEHVISTMVANPATP